MTTSAPDPVELVDRERALRRIHALIAEAQSREEAALVRIVGPPGIGKSALMRTAVDRYAPWRWSVASAGQRAVPGGWLATIGLEDEYSEEDVFERICAALSEIDTLCIDDAQWLDERSARLIRRLHRVRGSTLTMLFADRRDNAPDLPPHHTVPLAPLRATATERLVHSWYPNATKAVTDEIAACAAGNPFIVLLLTRAARDAGARRAADTEPSLEAVVAARLDRCTPLAREAIRYAALLEAPVDVAPVAYALGQPPAKISRSMSDVQDLASVEDGWIRFRHALIADAVRNGLADLSTRYARLLAAFDPGETRIEALTAMLRCARGAGDTAATAALALRLGRTLASAGLLGAALNFVTSALEYAPRPLPADYAIEYAGVLQHLAREGDAGRFLRGELRAALERQDVRSAAILLHSYAGVAISLEREAEFEDLRARVASAIWETSFPGDAESIVRSAHLLTLASTGRLDRFQEIAGSGSLRWSDYRYAALVAALRGDSAGARDAFQRYEAGLTSLQLRHTATDRAMAAQLGLFSIGNGALRAADGTWRADAEPGSYVTGTALRLIERINDGRWTEAEAICVAISAADEPDEPYQLLDARLLFAGLSRRAPAAPERTLRGVRALISAGRLRHAIAASSWLWLAYDAAGLDTPKDIQNFVATGLDATPMPYLIGGIPLAVARLAERLGVERCRAALSSRVPFASRWHVAHDDLARGILEGDVDKLRRARDAFDALDAPVFAMLAGVALPIPRATDSALSERLFPRDTAASSTQFLTAREHSVAELAATGARNREIAEHLGIAERTVEVHLGNAFRKLGVRSRAGLAHALLGRGVRVQL